MKFEEYKKLPYADQMALIQFAQEYSNSPNQFDDRWDRMVYILKHHIENELEEIAKQFDEQRRYEEQRHQFQIWDSAFTNLIQRYPKRYRMFFGTVYMVIQEADDGITMRELRDYMAEDNWKHMSDYIFTIMSEVYDYCEWVKKDDKICYKNRTMTIGKGWYDDWKKAFNPQIPWSLKSALRLDIGLRLPY